MPTALIVEDEPEANKLLGMLVRLRGYQIRSAFTGKEALQHVEAAAPDIVFLDLMLPDLNGYEICKILKSSKRTSLVPLVIVTARIAAENRIESFCLGADDYIAKPYTPDQIFQAMERAVHWHDQSRAPQVRGDITFDHKDDGEILRRLGQLRSLIFARTSVDLEGGVLISRAIKELWCIADEWARAYPGTEVTSFSYMLCDERLVLGFGPAGGWLHRVRELRLDPTSSLRLAGFDHVDVDEPAGTVTLTKLFQQG